MSDAAAAVAKARFVSTLGNFAKTVLPYLVVPAAGAIASYHFGKKQDKEDHEQLKNSFSATLALDENMAKNPQAAEARFRELAFVSPTIAKNPAMAARFISNRMDSGLTVDDIHKLSVIEASSKSNPNAAARATAKAALIFDRLFSTWSLTSRQNFINEQQGIDKKYLTDLQQMQKKGGVMNPDVQQKVSDECIGEMLADRYIIMMQGMEKEAGVKPGIMSAGMNRLKAGAQFMAPIMALGGLAHGIGMIVDARRKKQMDQAANENFFKLKQHSEIVQGNPELANQALDAIKTFAPALAAKPAVLKTFVEHTINAGMIAPQTVSDLATAQGNVSKSQAPGFASGFLGAVKSTADAGKFLSPQSKDIADAGSITDDRW